MIWAKGDSAASKNYWRPQDAHILENIVQYQGPSVLLPNNESIASTKKGQLPLSPNLTKAAKTAQILPQLASSSLISLGQLCDDDCIVLLHKKVLLAIKNKEVILQGIRNPIDQLWDIPVSKEIITEGNYPMPSIYPGIYPTRTRTHKKRKW